MRERGEAILGIIRQRQTFSVRNISQPGSLFSSLSHHHPLAAGSPFLLIPDIGIALPFRMDEELRESGITLSMDGKVVVLMGTDRMGESGSEIGGGCDQLNNTASSGLISNKKRPSKPQGPEYEYFKIVGERPNGKGYRLRCGFCNAREMNSHAPRMRKHLVYKCTGNVPESVKDKFRNHKPVYTKNEEKIRKSSRKRTAIHFDSGNTSDEDEEDDDVADFAEKNRDLQLLFQSQMTRKSEETTAGKKPLKQFTDEDFDREQKELLTKKMRLEIKVMEDQSKFWSKMGNGVDKILKAVDLYIESKVRAAEQEMPQVHTLYTNPDGSAVLQAAFAETINNNGTGDVA